MKLWKSIFALCLALTMVLAMAACTGTPEETTGATDGETTAATGGETTGATDGETTGTTETTEATDGETVEATNGETTEIPADGSTLGEGQHSFTFQVTMTDGTAYNYTIQTDAETVGQALLDLGLIDGDESDYGLYVTTVLGVTLDYTADGYWWALSENGTDTTVGVDGLTVTDGSTYAFTATPA